MGINATSYPSKAKISNLGLDIDLDLASAGKHLHSDVVGGLTGNVTGNADSATTATSAAGITAPSNLAAGTTVISTNSSSTAETSATYVCRRRVFINASGVVRVKATVVGTVGYYGAVDIRLNGVSQYASETVHPTVPEVHSIDITLTGRDVVEIYLKKGAATSTTVSLVTVGNNGATLGPTQIVTGFANV